MATFAGRLFGPGLPGTGVAAEGHWRGAWLICRTADGEFATLAPQLEARGFNAAQLSVAWTAVEGDFAFFIESAPERAAFAAAAPAEIAAALRGIDRRLAGIARRYHFGWAALLLFAALPLLVLGLLATRSEGLGAWLVARIPVEHEARLGDLVLAQTRARMPLREDGAAVEALRAIGDRLTPGTPYRYRWFVAERPELNAFAAPGGVVVVFSGLIAASRSPEELAGVLAHEVAHTELRHSLQVMLRSLGLRALVALALGDISGSVFGDAATRLAELGFSRDAERAADSEGLRRLLAAGIDPRGMLSFFDHLEEKGGTASLPALLSTHPPSAERRDALRRQIEAAAPAATPPLAIPWPPAQR